LTVRASVVVPTYRRPDLLDRCLEAVTAQDLDPADYEVLIADDAACEETRRQVEAWAARARPAVRYLPVLRAHGPAAARNVGWRNARGEIIAFTDDDTVPAPGWLRAGVAAVEAGADAVTGRVEMPLPERPTDYERNESHLARAEFVTANCFCRRAVLEAVGGFDERFTMAWREDSDLHFTLLERGYRIVREPDAVVVHPVRPARWGVSLSQQRKARFNALLYKKHPQLYRERIRPRPPWSYYGIGAGLVAALAGTAAGLAWLALAGGATWAALTGWFCARRLRHTSTAPRHVAEMVVTSLAIPFLSIYWRLRGAFEYRVFFL
jgi:glycosyltransferase involved in cell wall biosynthesis